MPLTQEQIQTYIEKEGAHEEGNHWRTVCPSCSHPGRKFYINKDDGLYTCFHCNTNSVSIDRTEESSRSNSGYDSRPTGRIEPNVITKWVSNLNSNNYRTKCYNYLINERHLTKETIEEFQLGYDPEEGAITIPNINFGKVDTVTYRYLDKEDQRYKTAGSKGWCFIDKALSLQRYDMIVIFEGEFDAITSYQLYPNLPAIATQGKNVCKDILKDYLAKFKRIYICYDDNTDKEVLRLAEMLGKERCFSVQLPKGNDLNKLLHYKQTRLVYLTCLKQAKRLGRPLVTNLAEIQQECEDYFKGTKVKSTSTGFTALDSIAGGIRQGELYVISGDTELGKTTFTTNMILNLAKSGVRTTVCSLEVPFKSHILPSLMSFIVGRNINYPKKIKPSMYQQVYKFLSEWNAINLIDRVGFLSKEDLIKALDVSYKLGYKCFVLDNIQYVLRKENNDEINDLIRTLHVFTKEHPDYTIIAIVNARKPTIAVNFKDQTSKKIPLTKHDMKGSSDLYYVPDNVWLMNKDEEGVVSLKVDKLRTNSIDLKSGGVVNIYFDKIKFEYTVVEQI